MKLSVLQWNIYYKEDPRNIVALLKEYDADIVCLQELTIDADYQAIKDVPAYIAEQLGFNYYYKDLPLESTDGKMEIFANGIFSRYPIIDKKFAWINQPKGGGGYGDEYRAYVEVAVEVEGSTVSVGTAHMSYTHRFEPTSNKVKETNLLIDNLKKHSSKFIFSGDLNALPDSETIKIISRVLQNAGPDVGQKTWATKPFSYNGFEETELNWRLDYIFATADMKVLSSEVIKTEYSDHLPIITVFSV